MSISPTPLSGSEGRFGGTPAPQEKPVPRSAVIALGIVTLVGLVGLFLYAQQMNQRINNRLDQVNATLESTLSSQEETLARLHQRLEQGEARDTELQGQVATAREHLGTTQSELQKARQMASELARQQKESSEQLAGQLGQLTQEQVATKGNVGALSTDVAGVKTEVKTTKDELASTRAQLQRVIGDLGVQSDLVAHNREELAELRQRGEREYIEFNLRTKDRSLKIAGIQMQLKKTDVKRNKFTVNLVVDDRTIEKKDKTVFEPVQFYRAGYRTPTEIVVNQVQKDQIVGYVSVPKKMESREPMTSGT